VIAGRGVRIRRAGAARTAPNCHLAWTTLAALGEVESAHGSAGGAVLGADGSVQPPIYGLPLDGKGGRQLIRDTDQGTIDGITTYDRAVGPMQFIPSTWRENAVDADNSGAADPNDIDDAALTAASYLCKNGRDLSRAGRVVGRDPLVQRGPALCAARFRRGQHLRAAQPGLNSDN
jgi:membrane-bound lytic murein transglycosylase B